MNAATFRTNMHRFFLQPENYNFLNSILSPPRMCNTIPKPIILKLHNPFQILPLFIPKAIPIVHKQFPIRAAILPKCHHQCKRIFLHHLRASSRPFLHGDNISSFNKRRHISLLCFHLNPPSTSHFLMRMQVVPPGCRHIDPDTLLRRPTNRHHHECIANMVLVLQSIRTRIIRVLQEHGLDHRGAQGAVLVEQGVPVGEQSIPELQGVADVVQGLFSEDPGLPPLGLYVCVRSEKRGEGPDLVPPHHQFRRGLSEEAPHIRAAETDPPKGHRQAHRHRGLQELPLGGIVPRPLRAGIKGPGQHKGPLFLISQHKPLGGGPLHEHAVQVVYIPMLHPFHVQIGLGHGVLRPPEHRGFVHIVPDKHILTGIPVVLQQKLLGPQFPHLVPRVVRPRRLPRPAVGLVVLVVLGLHQVTYIVNNRGDL